jgi:hypothetical protein
VASAPPLPPHSTSAALSYADVETNGWARLPFFNQLVLVVLSLIRRLILGRSNVEAPSARVALVGGKQGEPKTPTPPPPPPPPPFCSAST